MSIHNSFDVIEDKDQVTAKSHNFQEFIGQGKTKSEALLDLDEKILNYSKIKPDEYKKRVKARIDAGLECGCGKKLESPVFTIYGKLV